MPWCLIISTIILAFALLIKHVLAEKLEEGKTFVWLVVAFLIVYLIGALAMSFLNPLEKIQPLFAAPQTQEVQDTVVKL